MNGLRRSQLLLAAVLAGSGPMDRLVLAHRRRVGQPGCGRAGGVVHVCRLDPAPLASASAWLHFYERHWEERLDALERLFRPAETEPTPNPEREER